MENQLFCPNCGKPSEPGKKFCAACGTQIPDAPAPQPQAMPDQAAQAAQAAPQQAAQAADTYAQARQTQQVNAQSSMPQANPVGAAPAGTAKSGAGFDKKILIIALAAVAVIVIVIVLLYNLIFKYTKIDAKDLIKVEFKGLDGSGTVTAELNAYPSYMYLDTDDIKDALGGLGDYDDDDLDDLSALLGGGSSSSKSKETVSKYLSIDNKTLKKAYDTDDVSDAKKMRKALLKTDTKGEYKIKAKASKTKGLKNGDKVKITVKYPEDALKDKNIKLTNTEFEVTVKGLTKGKKIDPFEGVEVSFTGFDGQGYASVNSTAASDKYGYSFAFDYSYTSDLKNGDQFPVTCYFYSELTKDGDTAYFEYNKEYYIIDAKDLTDDNKLVKNYTVEGLTALSEIDPFEGITFEYSGAAPFLKPSYVNSDSVNASIKDYVYFDVDCDKYLGEDGEFEVSCTGYYSLRDAGYTLKGADSEGVAKKTFKVADLTDAPAYVTKDNAEGAAEFYKDKLGEMAKEAADDMKGRSFSYLTNADGDVEEAELTYTATYVAFTKDTEYDYSTVNRVYWLYKASFKTDEGKEAAFYYVFYTTDLKVYPDGSYTNPDDIYISSTTVKNMDAFNETYVDGYKDDFTTEKAAS